MGEGVIGCGQVENCKRGPASQRRGQVCADATCSSSGGNLAGPLSGARGLQRGDLQGPPSCEGQKHRGDRLSPGAPTSPSCPGTRHGPPSVCGTPGAALAARPGNALGGAEAEDPVAPGTSRQEHGWPGPARSPPGPASQAHGHSPAWPSRPARPAAAGASGGGDGRVAAAPDFPSRFRRLLPTVRACPAPVRGGAGELGCSGLCLCGPLFYIFAPPFPGALPGLSAAHRLPSAPAGVRGQDLPGPGSPSFPKSPKASPSARARPPRARAAVEGRVSVQLLCLSSRELSVGQSCAQGP